MNEDKRGPGRPKFSPEVKRGRHISVRLTEEEYQNVKKMAEFDESLSDFFRRLFLNSTNNKRGD